VFKTLAKQFGRSHAIEFVIVDATLYKEFVAGVGLSEEELPTFALFHPVKRQEHFFPKAKQKLNVKNARRWLESFLAGKLSAEEKREFYSEGDAVVQLTPETFSPVVYDTSKDVLVEFYAPWCGHCAALAPHYKAVAERFKPHPSMVIASFDASKHEPPKNFNVTGLPTILFFPAEPAAGEAKKKNSSVPLGGVARDRNGITRFLLTNQKSLAPAAVESLQKQLEEEAAQNQGSGFEEAAGSEVIASAEDTE